MSKNGIKSCPLIPLVAAAIVILVCVLQLSLPVYSQDTSQNQQQLADKVYDYSINCWWRSFIVTKLMNFTLAPAIWQRMLDDNDWGIKTANNVAIGMGEYAKNHGLGDLEAAESANNNDRNANKPQVEQMVDALKGKISFTLKADAVKGTPSEWDLIHRYMGVIGEELASSDFKPRGGAALITLIVTPTAKDLTVAANPDGQHFTITAASLVEPAEWDTKIKKGLERGR